MSQVVGDVRASAFATCFSSKGELQSPSAQIPGRGTAKLIDDDMPIGPEGDPQPSPNPDRRYSPRPVATNNISPAIVRPIFKDKPDAFAVVPHPVDRRIKVKVPPWRRPPSVNL